MTVLTGYSNYEINGIPLQTLGWNLVHLTGLDGMPARRGQNLPTPYQDGDFSFGEKFYDSRSFIAKMMVLPQDSDGVVNAVDGGQYNLRSNFDYLKGVFNLNPGLQVLSFDVFDGAGGSVTREIDVEILAPFHMNESNKHGLEFSMEMIAPRPFWREMPIETVNENGLTGLHNFNIDTAGNAPIGDLIITIDVNAASSTPSLEVVSNGDKITFVDTTLVNTDQIVIDLGAKSFELNGDRADAAIIRETSWFMRLAPSAALAMRFDCVSGDYDLQLEYHKKWL